MKTKKLPKINFLVKKLDHEFSIFIRNRDHHVCFTCGKQLETNQSQCGHYQSRSYKNTRWDEDNCSCQCVKCNVFMKGNYPAYSLRLVKKYGIGILEDLELRAKQPFKLERSWLNDQIEYYKTKNKELK